MIACFSMEHRQTKLARLRSLRDRLPYISQSALAAVLQIAKKEPLPSGHRKDLKAARDEVAKIHTPYGTLHRTIKLPHRVGGEDISVEMQDPFAMMYHCCETSRPFSALVSRCVAARPPTLATPWNIIFYTDEVSPGNQLGYKHPRKLWAIYWSVLEFGPEVLSDEDTTNQVHNPVVPNRMFMVDLYSAAALLCIL